MQVLKACAEVARHPRGTDRRLVVDPRHYDGPGTERVIAPPPLGRMGRAEEFASIATFLASDAASYITGTSINVDGGRSPIW